MPRVAGAFCDADEDIVCELEAADIPALFDREQAAVDEIEKHPIGVGARDPGSLEGGARSVEGHTLAVAFLAEQRLLDKSTQRGRVFGEAVVVESFENAVGFAIELIGVDDRLIVFDPRFVQLGANEREQRGDGLDLLDREVRRRASDKADDGRAGLLGDDRRLPLIRRAIGPMTPQAAWHEHGVERLRAGERAELDAIIHERRHVPPPALESVEKIVAQRQQHAAWRLAVDEALGQRVVFFEALAHRVRDTILDDGGQRIAKGARGFQVVVAEREDFLELVEDEHEAQVAAGDAAGAIVEKEPEAGVGRKLRERREARAVESTANLVDDLLAERRRVVVAQAQIHGKEPSVAQAWEQAGVEQRRLAQPAAAEEHGQRLVLDALEKIEQLRFAPEKVTPHFFAERSQAEPRFFGRDAFVVGRECGIHSGKSAEQLCFHSSPMCPAKPDVTAPPGSGWTCALRKHDGSFVSGSGVSSMTTGT